MDLAEWVYGRTAQESVGTSVNPTSLLLLATT